MSESYKHSYKVSTPDTVSLAVYNVGLQKCEPGYCWGPGVRDHFLLHHIVSGKGVYTTGNNVYPLSAGDSFMVFPFSESSYKADEDDPWEYCWVGFAGSDAKLLVEQTDFSPKRPIMHAGPGNNLQDALLDIYCSRGGKNYNNVQMTGMLYLLLAKLIQESSKTPRTADLSLLYTQKATQFISYNFSHSITVETLSAYVGISRSHLYRVFMQNLGVSPNQYLSEFRIKQACELLKSSGLSVAAIANSVGFEDHLYFSKVFRKYKNTTPSAYAKSHRQK